jgi:hypothetical protein
MTLGAFKPQQIVHALMKVTGFLFCAETTLVYWYHIRE